MKKENKIIASLIILFSLIAIVYCIYLVINRNKEVTDAVKFRNEYMELNDKMNEDEVYTRVIISENNTVKYITLEKLLTILKSETGLIYIGNSTSTECRNIVETLVDVAIEKNETIYYYNKDLNVEALKIINNYYLEKNGINYNSNIPIVLSVSKGKIVDFEDNINTLSVKTRIVELINSKDDYGVCTVDKC